MRWARLRRTRPISVTAWRPRGAAARTPGTAAAAGARAWREGRGAGLAGASAAAGVPSSWGGRRAGGRRRLGCWVWLVGVGGRGARRQQRVGLGLDLGDLAEQQLQPVELAQDLALHVLGQGPAVAGGERLELLPAAPQHRIVVGDPLRE